MNSKDKKSNMLPGTGTNIFATVMKSKDFFAQRAKINLKDKETSPEKSKQSVGKSLEGMLEPRPQVFVENLVTSYPDRDLEYTASKG